LPTVIEKLFPAASRIVAAVMERGARTHQGEDWRAFQADFHLARARRHLNLLAAGDVREPHLARQGRPLKQRSYAIDTRTGSIQIARTSHLLTGL
jgi:hypothetical protein